MTFFFLIYYRDLPLTDAADMSSFHLRVARRSRVHPEEVFMRDPHRWDAKSRTLRQHGALNVHADRVTDPAFQNDDFFDPRDLVQVKYEMVRRVRKEGRPATEVAKAFGVSRPTLYHADAALTREGLPGLLPKKRGPHGGHKITAAVARIIAQELAADDPAARGIPELLALLRERHCLKIHRRTLERAIARLKKKRL